MFKLISHIKEKYSFKVRLIFYLSLIILLLSIINIGLVYDKYNTEPKIITKEIPIEKIITVTKIETIIKAEKIPIIKENKSSTSNLNLLENGKLNIKIENFEITEGSDGKIYFPETIFGVANLEYLYWNISVDLKPQIKYKRSLFDLSVGIFGIAYADTDRLLKFSSNYFLMKNIKFPFGISLPVLENNINIGIGLPGVTITKPIDIFSNLKCDFGGGFLWCGNPALIIGLSLKI